MAENPLSVAPPAAKLLIATLTGAHSPSSLTALARILSGVATSATLMDLRQFVVRSTFTAMAAVELRPPPPSSSPKGGEPASGAATAAQSSAVDGGGGDGRDAVDGGGGDGTGPAPADVASTDIVKQILLAAHTAGFEVEFDVVTARRERGDPTAVEDAAGTGEGGGGVPGDALGNHNRDRGSADSGGSGDGGGGGGGDGGGGGGGGGGGARDTYAVTLVAPGRMPPAFLGAVSAAIAGAGGNIHGIERRTAEGDAFSCYELGLRMPAGPSGGGGERVARLRTELMELSRAQPGADLAIQRGGLVRRAKRLVVFDLSWTLLQGESMETLLAAAGVALPPEGETVDVHGMSRFRRLARLLAGTPVAPTLARLRSSLTLTPGAATLCRGLHKLGCKLAVISSGPLVVAQAAKAALDLDMCYGNALPATGGRFTGGIDVLPEIDGPRKAELLAALAMQEQVSVDQVVAIGDGPVSAAMLGAAGLAIAFDQPGAVAARGGGGGGRIASKSLASVLYLMGMGGADVRHACEEGM